MCKQNSSLCTNFLFDLTPKFLYNSAYYYFCSVPFQSSIWYHSTFRCPSPNPQTSFLVGTNFAVSYTKTALPAKGSKPISISMVSSTEIIGLKEFGMQLHKEVDPNVPGSFTLNLPRSTEPVLDAKYYNSCAICLLHTGLAAFTYSDYNFMQKFRPRLQISSFQIK